MGAKLKNDYLVDTLLSTKINDYYFFLMENMELGHLKSFNENEINIIVLNYYVVILFISAY